MIRFAATLLTMLGLALGSTTSVVFSAPLCAAPGETTCSCAKAATSLDGTTQSCCSVAQPACCGGSQGNCCQQSSSETRITAPSCDGCSCCIEPSETPLIPATSSETHTPVDLLTWSAPLAPEYASPPLSACDREDLRAARTVSLQVLHCRWLN